MTFTEQFLAEATEILKQIDVAAVERLAAALAECRAGGGRLFILGVGGSAANASHAVNDFRKLVGIETYAPTDNVSELTARVNLNMTAPLTLDQVWEVATPVYSLEAVSMLRNYAIEAEYSL